MINKDIFYTNGLLNKNRLRESWVEKNMTSEYSNIKYFQVSNNLKCEKFSNVIFNYVNGITYIPKCEYCKSSEKRFLGFQEGYDNFCSKKCASKYSLPNALIKRRENTLEKFGVEHTSMLDSVKSKQSKTNIDRYGFKSPTMNSDIKTKQENTMLERYGVKYTGNSEELMNKVFNTRYDKYKDDLLKRYNDLNIVDIRSEGDITINCDICNKNYDIKTPLLRLRYFVHNVNTCLHCNTHSSYKYSGQNEIFDLLSNLGIEVIMNDRSILNGKEIDIYLPEYKIAIEFNGLYWHSHLYKDKDYHLNKKIRCLEMGINLIHIWEDDWLYKRDIVSSRLINLINRSNEFIFARKCKVVELKNYEVKTFLDENHLQGSINSSYCIGLVFNDRLVSVMTFGKFRRSLGLKGDDNDWELYRFCSLLGINVIGGFSKLLKHFENNVRPNSIITYANRDWSFDSNVYEKVGFNFVSNTSINYWYFGNDTKRQHRFNFRKDKLIKEGFSKDKTEKEIMSDRGYNLVYDCGSIKYEKIFKY